MDAFKDIVKRTDAILKNFSAQWLKNAWLEEKNINAVLDLLSDQFSREQYCKDIMYCFLNKFLKGELAANLSGMMSPGEWKRHMISMYSQNIHPEIDAPEWGRQTLDISKTTAFILDQYRYDDKVMIKKDDICLDLGACYGETAIWMQDNGAREVYVFEIDPVNFSFLLNNILKQKSPNAIHPVRNAVSNTSGDVYLVQNHFNPGASSISSTKPQNGQYEKIGCVTLDEFCEHRQIKPNFIKMDIEGAELDAINGAAGLFAAYRPKFAICIYHKWEHRWQIPLRLKELCEDYDFYVKKSHPIYETVFYGCPQK